MHFSDIVFPEMSPLNQIIRDFKMICKSAAFLREKFGDAAKRIKKKTREKVPFPKEIHLFTGFGHVMKYRNTGFSPSESS